MTDIGTFTLGIAGGVLGAFFKLWIDDFREWCKSRLTPRERELLTKMHSQYQNIPFEVRQGWPPVFSNRIENLDRPDLNFKFKDLGETLRLSNLGLIEKVTSTDKEVIFRITGKGYKAIERLRP